jgi:RimJ/RimL family protein N-acetyltransferase
MIRGKHVYLRGLEKDDLQYLHKLMNDEEVMELARFRPDHMISMEGLEKEYEDELKQESGHRRTFIIVDSNSSKPIGWANIRWWRPFSTSAELGIAIGEKEYRGKGIGTEVVGLLTDLAFDQYNMHKVEMFTRQTNRAMLRAAEKNGYKVEGVPRETIYFNGKYHDGVILGLLRSERTAKTPNA